MAGTSNASFLFPAICLGLFITLTSAAEEGAEVVDVPATGPSAYEYATLSTLAPEPAVDPFALYCASKISFDCSLQINANEHFDIGIRKKCCNQLVGMGKKCNDALVREIVGDLESEDKAKDGLARSDYLWNACTNPIAGQ